MLVLAFFDIHAQRHDLQHVFTSQNHNKSFKKADPLYFPRNTWDKAVGRANWSLYVQKFACYGLTLIFFIFVLIQPSNIPNKYSSVRKSTTNIILAFICEQKQILIIDQRQTTLKFMVNFTIRDPFYVNIPILEQNQ